MFINYNVKNITGIPFIYPPKWGFSCKKGKPPFYAILNLEVKIKRSGYRN